MKRNELIELLKTLPEDAEIVTVEGDDILGDYSFNTQLDLNDEIGYQATNKKGEPGAIYTNYSNYKRKTDPEVKVWVIS